MVRVSGSMDDGSTLVTLSIFMQNTTNAECMTSVMFLAIPFDYV